ncbi:MAG: NAD(P)-dependent alcohol dehydrogenase [Solirubrobacteraceae bacterium]
MNLLQFIIRWPLCQRERRPDMNTKAALSSGAQEPFEIADVELDEPRADEVLVKLTAAGVCHTDLATKAAWPQDKSPIVLGHEGAGVVEAAGTDVTAVRPGQHVLLSYRSCRSCPTCKAGHPPYCRDFRTLNLIGSRPDGSTTMRRDGSPVYGSFFGQSSFASHALAYQSNVVAVEDDIDLTIAAPLGCGVQTGAGAVLNVLRPESESSLVVFGAGGVGLSALMVARVAGVGTIIAVEPVTGRRLLATELGATASIDPLHDDVVDAIRELTGGGATHALDTTANGAVINQAIEALATLGTLALVGVGPAEVQITVRNVIGGGKTIRGVVEGDAVPHQFIPRLLALHHEGRLPLEKLIRKYRFDEINQAVADAARGAAIKPVLVL